MPVFEWIKLTSNISDNEFARTFNCGIGGIIFVQEEKADKLLNIINETGEDAWIAGQIEKRKQESVIIEDTETSWR